jgi:predicted RNase H-like HicB family nuclease
MSTIKTLEVHAIWDEEAKVWVATSDDVPGLATEADTSEFLVEKLKILIPELLEANGVLESGVQGEIPFHLVSEREVKAYL